MTARTKRSRRTRWAIVIVLTIVAELASRAGYVLPIAIAWGFLSMMAVGMFDDEI